MDLNALSIACNNCTNCQLAESRTNVVFGQGNENTSLLFIGEGPGEQEDLSGIPFVGKSGQLFDKMLEAVELTRDDIYIANIVKCRPPGNRNPKTEEIQSCIPYLYQQIELINPEIIVCLGKVAAENIIHDDFKITKERGLWHYMNNRHYMATYHPSFLLRDPSRKSEAWSDFKEIKNAYRLLKKDGSN
jgi:DNA polymerase